jgi:phosphohistidine phosphatase
MRDKQTMALVPVGGTMKTLLILRHAKTQPDAPNGDHVRQLTNRGHRDAESIAAYIQRQLGTPDAVVTSDARRAMQTAEIVAHGVGFAESLTVEPRIYAASSETLLDVVRALPDDADSVILVGHNPGFEKLAEVLSGGGEDVRLPTSAFARLEFDATNWAGVQPGSGRLREIATRHTIS